MTCNNFLPRSTRRAMLRNSACGFGQIALSGLLAQSVQSSPTQDDNPFLPKQPHFKQRAKRVIFLFMWGGPSQVDTFDPKPRLNEDEGKPFSLETVGGAGPAMIS